MSPGVLVAVAALCSAFWTAILRYRGPHPSRFAAALVLGAGFAHLGWWLQSLPATLAHPGSLLDVSRGFSVLFLPLGPLLLLRTACAFAPLPLALAVARTGCLAAGCCHGPAGEPTPLVEIAGWLLLHGAVRRLPPQRVPPAVLAAAGALRLATEPWRADPPLGPPAVPSSLLAAGWVVLAAVWAVRSGRGDQSPSSSMRSPMDCSTYSPVARRRDLRLAMPLRRSSTTRSRS